MSDVCGLRVSALVLSIDASVDGSLGTLNKTLFSRADTVVTH